VKRVSAQLIPSLKRNVHFLCPNILQYDYLEKKNFKNNFTYKFLVFMSVHYSILFTYRVSKSLCAPDDYNPHTQLII